MYFLLILFKQWLKTNIKQMFIDQIFKITI